MNRTILFAAFAASVALAGCGGGGSTAPLTGTDAASALGKVASMDTDDIPAASPDMSPSPCPHPAWDAKPGGPPRPKPDGEIRNARPVHQVGR